MRKTHRILGLAVVAATALAGSAHAQGRRVVVVRDRYVLSPVQTIYAPPVTTVYDAPVVTRTPIGPTAYVTPAPVAVVSPTRYVTTTQTVVPTGTVFVDRAVVPAAYEVVSPRKVKFIYPRRYGRGY